MKSTARHGLRQLSQDYLLVERAIAYLDSHATEQPDLTAVANSVGLSEFTSSACFHVGRASVPSASCSL